MTFQKVYTIKKNVRVGDFLISTHVGYSLYINNQTINWTVNNG